MTVLITVKKTKVHLLPVKSGRPKIDIKTQMITKINRFKPMAILKKTSLKRPANTAVNKPLSIP